MLLCALSLQQPLLFFSLDSDLVKQIETSLLTSITFLYSLNRLASVSEINYIGEGQLSPHLTSSLP